MSDQGFINKPRLGSPFGPRNNLHQYLITQQAEMDLLFKKSSRYREYQAAFDRLENQKKAERTVYY